MFGGIYMGDLSSMGALGGWMGVCVDVRDFFLLECSVTSVGM